MAENKLNDFAQTLKDLEHDLIFMASLVEQMSYVVSNMSGTCVRAGGQKYFPPLKR